LADLAAAVVVSTTGLVGITAAAVCVTAAVRVRLSAIDHVIEAVGGNARAISTDHAVAVCIGPAIGTGWAAIAHASTTIHRHLGPVQPAVVTGGGAAGAVFTGPRDAITVDVAALIVVTRATRTTAVGVCLASIGDGVIASWRLADHITDPARAISGGITIAAIGAGRTPPPTVRVALIAISHPVITGGAGAYLVEAATRHAIAIG
jgi:hypothetical protein